MGLPLKNWAARPRESRQPAVETDGDIVMANNDPRKGSSQKKDTTSQKGQKRSSAQNRSSSGRRFAERQEAKEAAAREQRRARNRIYGLAVIGLVVLVVAVLVVVKVAGSGGGGGSGQSDASSPPRGTPIPTATLTKLASVPLSTLNAAPTNGVINTPQATAGAALTSDGKPELLYIGAEYCPHCAAERWALYLALSKFGTFSPAPGRIHSAVADGNVPTLTFYGTKYSSPYLAFTPVEVYTNELASDGQSYVPLQTPTPAQQRLWTDLGSETFPFLDFGGKKAQTGATYSYVPLQNLSFSTVADQVGNNSTTIGANIDAAANQLIKTICGSLTQNKPADVCSPTGS
jgi:thiol-disulfide isomerase/thioredoxin